jgi:hypothetical protein
MLHGSNASIPSTPPSSTTPPHARQRVYVDATDHDSARPEAPFGAVLPDSGIVVLRRAF